MNGPGKATGDEAIFLGMSLCKEAKVKFYCPFMRMSLKDNWSIRALTGRIDANMTST